MANAMVWILLLIFLLVGVDKTLTYLNIKAVEKNFPEIDRYSIEKNPVGKFFFKKLGLGFGMILYSLFSVVTFLVALFLLKWCLSLLGIPNAFSISLWVSIIVYCIVIGNNLFFLLKYSRIVP